MNKVKYYWKMSVGEAMRLASSHGLDVPEDELYNLLKVVDGWETRDASVTEERKEEYDLWVN